MIKKFWIVRSREKLFWGLTFTVSIFMLLYTLLNITVMDSQIPWQPFFFSADGSQSKYVLLLLPVISLLFDVLLHLDLNRKSPPSFLGGTAETAGKRLELYRRMELYSAFLMSLFLFFWQLDRLNAAKQIPGFASVVPLGFLTALLIWIVYSLVKIGRAGKR